MLHDGEEPAGGQGIRPALARSRPREPRRPACFQQEPLPGGVHVFAPDGSHLGSIELDTPTSNVSWGGDGSTLYVTAGTAVYRIALRTKGLGF